MGPDYSSLGCSMCEDSATWIVKYRENETKHVELPACGDHVQMLFQYAKHKAWRGVIEEVKL